ncbi:hypothetical protein CVT26_003845 [Gymnopilus dilepis]|uniref:FAD-binding domain-containing protein n=1 Tax=Gymnopilus dilepis TaxID=231916 RepID=A0A409YV26_9AGAR|nr:hypothetical protein CVT26_003845 [Gymnopilus dilepis]
MSTPTLRVLISGAGISGPFAAYWLAKAGHDVTVTERAPALRKEGQTVDVRKEGLQILDWMGIREKIDERCTKEAGMRLVDDNGRVWATFPQAGDTSFTSEVEIVRGEMAMVVHEASDPCIRYLFGMTIDTFGEVENGIDVVLKDRNGESLRQTFDVIIVSEGLYSRTRAKAFNEDITKPITPFNLFSASFSLPANEDDSLWANSSMHSKRRMVLSRPDGFGRTRVTLMWFDDGPESRSIAHPSTSKDHQKEFIQSRYSDLLPSSPHLARLLDGLPASDDLYLAEIAQTKTSSWHRGRVVLVGDTAYCPSAFSGMGTTAAIVGAYVLAAELVRNPKDHVKAFAQYETLLRPWIEKLQYIPPGLITMNPTSQFAVNMWYWAMYAVSLLMKVGIASSLFMNSIPSADQTLPLPPPSIFDRADHSF